MKKILFGIITPLLLLAYDMSNDFYGVFGKAKEENKIVMLFLTQEGCPACEYMKDVVFEDARVAEFLKANFVGVEIDVYKDTLPKGIRAFGTPTFYFFDSDGQRIGRQLIGGMESGEFYSRLKEYIRLGN